MKYQLHTLANGLRIVLAPMSGETATVVVMTGTGSRYESEHENGMAHFLEHMFFKGTKKRKSARAISEELDAIGSISNAFTSKERTAYWAKVSGKYLDTALDVIGDIFLHSTLPSKEITKERGAIIQEIDMYEDMPMRTVNDVFDALIFGEKDPLGRTILGPKKNIHSFTRKDFVEYLKRNYTPQNTVVAIAGSFSTSKVLTKIKKEFGHLKSVTPPQFSPFVHQQNAPRVKIKEKKTDQTQLMIGVPSYPYLHKDEYAVEILATILGGGMSSRLFLEVREKRGLAYSVHAWTDKYPDTGYFVVQAGVEHAKLAQTITTVLNELRKIQKSKVGHEELAKAKAYAKGTRTLALETSDSVAEHAATSIINIGKVRKLEETLGAIDRVTVDDIMRVAQDLFRTNVLNLAVIGPHTDADQLRKLLQI
ncbi:MAG TPA: pitrilysin family protein [Candidatus Paceibacterota bacterium]|nr:pitrilysin family protein [Candidatus Paceibacterota bacterium]